MSENKNNLSEYNETIAPIADAISLIVNGKNNEGSSNVRDVLKGVKDHAPNMSDKNKRKLLDYLGLLDDYYNEQLKRENSFFFIRETAQRHYCNQPEFEQDATVSFERAEVLNDARIEFEKNFKG